MKLTDLIEDASAAATSVGSVASSAPVMMTRRRKKPSITVLQRETRESMDTIWKTAYHEGREDGERRAVQDKLNSERPLFSGPFDDSKRGRVTRANVYDVAYKIGYQNGYYEEFTMPR